MMQMLRSWGGFVSLFFFLVSCWDKTCLVLSLNCITGYEKIDYKVRTCGHLKSIWYLLYAF